MLTGAVTVGAPAWADDEAELSEIPETLRESAAVAACRELTERTASESAAVLAAFGEVCRSCMKLEPDVVLAAHLGPEMVATLRLDELDGAKPDKAALKGWRELLERTWKRRTAAT